MIKPSVLRWRDYPGLFTWAQCNYQGSYKREAGEQIKGNSVTMERERRERFEGLLL